MTLTLTHLTDLQRVRVALSDLPDGEVQIQRALNASATDAMWQQGIVRGGRRLAIQSGIGQVDDYEFFADTQNHYRMVPIDPAAGMLLSGDSGEYASTPNAAPLQITGDIDLICDATLDVWGATADNQTLVARYLTSGNQRSYWLFVTASGFLRIQWTTDGTSGTILGLTSSAPPPAADGERLAVWVHFDVDDGAGNRAATFWTAPTAAGPWTQLGTVQTAAGTTSMHAGTGTLTAGAFDDGSGNGLARLAGIVHSVEVRNSAGTTVADPNFVDQPGGTTGFADDAGRTWTVNGDAQVIGIESGSITPSLDGKVWLKSIRYPSLNRPLYRVLDQGGSIVRPAHGGLARVAGRGVPVAQLDARGSRRFVLPVQMPDQATADEFDVILTASSEFFIHVPSSLSGKVPGGYVWIDALDERRTTTSDRWVFELPCVAVAPPAPDIVGTTLTWGTVERLYGSWAALVGANPTWRDLLATVGSPDDVVVM